MTEVKPRLEVAANQRLVRYPSGQLQPHADNGFMVTARDWIREHPGAALLIGLAVGGLIGWLTSKRN